MGTERRSSHLKPKQEVKKKKKKKRGEGNQEGKESGQKAREQQFYKWTVRQKFDREDIREFSE